MAICSLENHELPTTTTLLCLGQLGQCLDIASTEEDTALEQDMLKAASLVQISDLGLKFYSNKYMTESCWKKSLLCKQEKKVFTLK